MNPYPDQSLRRPSTSTSIHSSRCTDNFTCPRQCCHCRAANLEQVNPADVVSLEDLESQRRRAEYFKRPPVLGPYPDKDSDNSSQSFQFEKLAKAEYCDYCQYCWALSRWCGRLSGLEVEIPPYQRNSSSVDFTRNQEKIPFPNVAWVQEPLIVNAARLPTDNLALREREQFVPAVFSHTLATQSLSDLSTRDVTYLREEGNLSQENIHPYRTLVQTPAKDCQRLRFCKDIRGARRDTWAFEEGSLVIGIHPSFVDLNQKLIQEDEFELRYGEVYVICQMFADKWALCARLRMSDSIVPVKDSDQVERGFKNIKFLPLCAVTLAANFASFDRRWLEYRLRYPYSSRFPSGGLRVTPPIRCESALASFEIAAKKSGSLHVPNVVFHLCKTRFSLPADTEYIPLQLNTEDIPLHQPKSSIGRLIENTVNGRNTLGRMWRSIVPCEVPESQSASGDPEVSLEKELGLEDESSSNSQCCPDPAQKEQSMEFNLRSPVKKRKSIRQLFFGSKRYKQLKVTEEEEKSHNEEKNITKEHRKPDQRC